MKKIKSALISVFYKEGLEPIVKLLAEHEVQIYSTGGTAQFIEKLGIKVIPVEDLTTYPSILGGRVKTLHPSVFGGILGRRDDEVHVKEMKEYNIPEIDLVIVDLYPFEETLAASLQLPPQDGEQAIIEKIDIGGPSMIRAAAKNFKDVLVVAAKKDYADIESLLSSQKCETTFEQRKLFAARAFEVIAHYDVVISQYFNPDQKLYFQQSIDHPKPSRYGENPHQQGVFFGNLEQLFDQLNGKELSYNNIVDADAAMQLMADASPPKESFRTNPSKGGALAVFAIIKHTNVCGAAIRNAVLDAWKTALAGDPESAFGGVLVCNGKIDKETANAINDIFFEVLIAPEYDIEALDILRSKKNRIVLKQKETLPYGNQFRSIMNGVLVQEKDKGSWNEWKEEGGRETTESEKRDLEFANIICKHLKSNAIALVKDQQLIGKGCGQTSRIDSLRQAIEKAKQFNFDLSGAVLASDAFFPFDDCVKMGHQAGITAFIQPGGSIRDKDSIEYCKQNGLAMVMTRMRHFRH